MFLVARRTKFRVVEKPLENNTSVINEDQRRTPTKRRVSSTPLAASNTTVYPNCSSPPHSSQAQSASLSSHAPQSQSQSHDISQQGSAPLQLMPNFSLQSYLCMAQGLPHEENPVTTVTTEWAQQLQRDGVLQLQNGPSHPRTQPRIFPAPPYTSTPLNPADVQAEELNVYWEDPRTFLFTTYIKP